MSTKLITAAATPLNKNLQIDFELYFRHLNYLLNSGSDAILILGTTGEANSFSLDERKELISNLADTNFKNEQIFLGTGCSSFSETIELSNFVLSKGFQNLLLLPPFYYKNVSSDGLINYFTRVFDSIKTQNPNIYFYHFPKMSGVGFDSDMINELKRSYPKLIKGIKDSSGEWESANNFLKSILNFEVFAGNEKFFLRHLNKGGAGIISATFNLLIEFASATRDLFLERNDKMFESESQLISLRKTIEAFPIIPAVKFLLSLKYNNENFNRVRPPLTELTKLQKENLLSELRNLDYRVK